MTPSRGEAGYPLARVYRERHSVLQQATIIPSAVRIGMQCSGAGATADLLTEVQTRSAEDTFAQCTPVRL